jgi:Xaa-Pro aminopeptidase
LTDFRYQESATRQAPGFKTVIYNLGPAQVLPDLFTEHKTDRLGLEGHHLTFSKYGQIEEALKKSRPDAGIISAEGLVESLRIVKEPEEIELIRHSLDLTENTLASVWELMEIGKTEKEIAWEIERRIRENGGESVSFPPIVAAGPNAALPHAIPTARRIAEGDPVILDLGSKLNHYCSDMTRTWIAGKPEKRMQEIYRIVHNAQNAALEMVKAGASSVEVDAAARDFIRQAGYGDYFGHGLGHGVGLAVHEAPGLRKFTPTVLEANMVVTIEPGIYIPGYGGVRLENMVRVTAEGCEVLNSLDLFYNW